MHINLSKFKKVKSDQHSTTLRHQDGHEIKIAHQALSPKMRGQLQSIEAIEQPKETKRSAQAEMKPVKMADGGEVEAEDKSDINSAVENAADAAKQAPVVINVGQPAIPPAGVGAPTGLPQEVAAAPAQDGPMGAPSAPDKAPSSAPDPQAAAQLAAAQAAPQGLAEGRSPSGDPAQASAQGLAPQAANQDPYGTATQQGAYEQGLKERKTGIFGEADAIAKSAKAQQEALDKAADMQMTAQQIYQKHYSELEQERSALQEDLKNQHIDPDHYFHSMDVPQKISTAIGLILGGFGAASSGKNMAVEYLQKQIENDIGAQKANLGKTESLLNANMKQFGNLKDATDMTRVMQMDMVSNQLKRAALTSTDMQAKAKALQAAGELDMQAAPIVGQMAMRKSLLTGMKNGHVEPERIVNFLVPEHQRAEATKELKDAKQMINFRDNALAGFDKLNELNTVGNRAAHLGFTPAAVDAIKKPLEAVLGKELAGRFTETDAKFFGSLLPSPGDTAATTATKRSQLNKFVSEKMNFPTLETYGIDMRNSGRFDSSGESRIKESAPVLKR